MVDETLDQIIIRSLNEGILTIECNGVVSSANPAALKILGLTREEIVGHSVESSAPDIVNNKDFLEIFHCLVTEGAAVPLKEVELTRHDGGKIQLTVSSAALDITECLPGMVSYVVLFRDITPLKNLETAKRKAADHLSHELKTPLSILKATIKSLWELCESNSKAYKLIERAERNLDRLLSIQDSVEQIFSPRKPHPQKLQVENFTNEIVAKILHIAHHREIKLEIDCENNGSIFFDPDIMEEILTILIKNAFENTPDKGLIKIVLSESNSGNFALTVHDYGVGIPFKDLEFIFEGFYHTQDTSEYSTKKPFDFNAGGKGLELFQLKRLSEIYKFKIDLQSRRCVYIPEPTDHCPGQINLCPYINKLEDCLCSGYSIFTVNFTNISL